MATYTDAFPLNNRASQIAELHAALDRLAMKIESDNLVAREANPQSVDKTPDWTSLKVQAGVVATGFSVLPNVTLVAVSVTAS